MKQAEIIRTNTATQPIDALRMSVSLGIGQQVAPPASDMPHIEDCPALSRADLAARVRWCEDYAVGGFAVEALEGKERGYRFRFGDVHMGSLFRLRFDVAGRTRSVRKG